MEYKNYPKSINGKQCIGPCYPKNTIFFHPQTLLAYKDDINNCPTSNFYNQEKDEIFWVDVCGKPTATDEDIKLNILSPPIIFNCQSFLEIYYDIKSFEDAISWIAENNSSLLTKLRVMECSWQVWGDNFNTINDQLIEFYINVIKKIWIKDIYTEIFNYIKIDNNNILFKVNNDKKSLNKVEKINFYIKKIINYQFIYDNLKTHIQENNKKWDKVINHNENIKKLIIQNSITKIQDIIKKGI